LRFSLYNFAQNSHARRAHEEVVISIWGYFRRNTGYIAISVFTLSLAVGANVAVLAVVNALWFRSLAIPHQDRVVMLLPVNEFDATSEGAYWAEHGLECYVRGLPVFARVAGQVATTGSNAEYKPRIRFERVGREVESIAVTWQYFSVMGLAVRGRDFVATDDQRGAEPVGIISDRLWKLSFNADRTIIGSVIDASPRPVRIIGVAPPGFGGARLGERADLWIPAATVPQLASPGLTSESSQPLLALARLKDGVSLAEAQRAIDAGANSCASPQASARSNSARLPGPLVKYDVVRIGDLYGGPQTRTIMTKDSRAVVVAAITAGLVFVGGCATLMSLVLMHYERRRKELAIRIVLGCPVRRLQRNLATELASIGLLGLAGAAALAFSTLQVLPTLDFTAGVDISRLDLAIDSRVLAGGVMAVGLTLALAAALPMARAIRRNAGLELVASSTRNTPSSVRLRRTLLAVHAAATVVVLMGAGLFLRTVQLAFGEKAGFDLQRTVFVRAQIASNTAPPSPAPRTQAEQQTLDAARFSERAHRIGAFFDLLSELPGLRGVSLGEAPIGLDQAQRGGRSLQVAAGSTVRTGTFHWSAVGNNYLDILGVRLLAGRGMGEAAVAGDAGIRSAVVTRSFAQTLWPDTSAIGQQFSVETLPHQVVGVAEDFAIGSLTLRQRAAIFVGTDVADAGRRFTLHFVVGTAGPAEASIRSIEERLRRIFPQVVGLDMATGQDLVARDLGRERLGASVFSGFGLLALGLAFAGVFGLVSYHAESRRRDLGIRYALGATSRRLIAESVLVGISPVFVGVVTGFGLTALIAQLVQSSVPGFEVPDVLVYLTTLLVVSVGAGLAAFAAARRLADVSPLDALRAD